MPELLCGGESEEDEADLVGCWDEGTESSSPSDLCTPTSLTRKRRNSCFRSPEGEAGDQRS